jgi:hypothetical protein
MPIRRPLKPAESDDNRVGGVERIGNLFTREDTATGKFDSPRQHFGKRGVFCNVSAGLVYYGVITDSLQEREKNDEI